MRRIIIAHLVAVLAIPVFATPIVAIEFVRVELGIIVRPVKYPCPVNPKTSKWAANDWDTHVVIHQRDVKAGDRAIAEVSVPNGKVFSQTATWRDSFGRGCTWLFVPILGTDAEAWLGTWHASISLNDKKVAEVSWEVTPAREGTFGEYQAYLAGNPKSAYAHYRVGAAAAFVGQDALGESELKEATKLEPTWWYPHLALGRLYQRLGEKDLALEQFQFLKGLLLGRPAEEGSFTQYVQTMLEDHFKELEK